MRSRGILSYHCPGSALSLRGVALFLAGWWSASAISAATFRTIDATYFSRVWQSTDGAASNTAAKAVDGSTNSFAVTTNAAGSFWSGELTRRFPIQRLELVNRPAPVDAELGGLKVRLYDLDDQVVFETTVTNPGPAATWSVDLPQVPWARTIWIGLPGTASNAAGNQRVGFAELRVLADVQLPFGPEPVPVFTNLAVTAIQTTDLSASYPASNGLDGNTGTFTHTGNFSNSYWQADLRVMTPVDRVEIVNRADCCDNRLGGLTLRIFDAATNSVYSAVITNPGLGKTWTNFPTAGTTGRFVRVGLENGATNGGGNYYVTLAEARFYSGTNQLGIPTWIPPVPPTGVVNYALGKTSCMVRLSAALAPASMANDGVYATAATTTTQTVDGYWEVDLGGTYAIYGARAIAPADVGIRMTNTVLRLFDEAHESVFSKFLTGSLNTFDVDAGGPYLARYVRVGLEDKKRTSPTGSTEWYIGMREVQVFGRPVSEVGIQSFSVSTQQISAGQSVTLNWFVEDVRHVEVRPAFGSVGAFTAANGIGSITQQPATSVEYLLVASNTAGVFTRAASVLVGTNTLPVRISEFVADNKYSLEDGNGDASDWIELRNPGNSNVNLAGWGLSDDPLVPRKWTFPATNLAAHETLIVFASGATSNDAAGQLHANFKLNADGGTLLLYGPTGAVVDAFSNYPALDTDLAYGRDPEGNVVFMEPTPRAPNLSTNYLGWLKPLKFSHPRGFYDVPFTLLLTNLNVGASVFYSTNGGLPTLPYSNGIAVTGTRSIRALVTLPGYRSPRVQTASYLFLDNVIASSTMSTTITQNASYAPRMRPGLLALPAVCMNLPGIPGYDEVEGSIEVMWPNGGLTVQQNCGISRFGGSWQDFNKRSFRADFRARYGAGRFKVPLFDGFDRGILASSSFDSLEFRAGNQDMNARGFYMAGRFVEDSMLDMGTLNPHGRFVHLYLNGTYWGQYDAREPLVDRMLADYLGGSVTNYLTVKGNDNLGSAFVLGTPEAPRTAPWERVYASRSNYTNLAQYVDIPNLIDFMLLWFYGNCEGEYRAAGPVEAGPGFKFWIADADGFLRTNAMGLNTTAIAGPADLLGSLVTQGHPDFKTLLADRIYRHLFNNGALTPTQNLFRLDARMNEILDSRLAECARWGYQSPASWEAAAQNIRTGLFVGRTTQLVAYLRGRGMFPSNDPPAFSVYGGAVTNGFQPVLTATTGTIYYTQDGIDPRLPGGGLSTNALVWTAGSVSITQDTTISARILTSDGQWTALAQPRFLLASRAAPTTRDLLVTEIHYNPAGSDETEFIEVYNAGTNLLDLSGVQFSNAVRFVFPSFFALQPGAFAVVTEDTNAFRMRYQDAASPWYAPGIVVAGQWSGALANSGETVVLAASNGTELVTIPYGTSGDWPERADGDGSSLELRTLPAATNDVAGIKALAASGPSWTSSSLYHGSPGRFDAFARTIKINEVLTHTDAETDWIELVNNGVAAADLSGLRLTDHYGFPTRFTIPPGTILAAGGYTNYSLSELGFGFSELGGLAALLSTSGTNVLRFLDTVDYPAMTREETMGSFTKSDGTTDFTELRAKTRNLPNALPRVGPLVFSEIHYAPATGMASFVEIANITTSAVSLFHTLYPTNVWYVDGIGPFYFPTGTVVAPCSVVLVCSTSPAAFRAQTGVSPSVPVFGPFVGALDPNGEKLKLMMPGDPELDGSVPYYRVDHLAYRAVAPWPAGVAGRSIERQPVEGYGNDPAYWRIGPAGGTPGVIRPNRAPQINATSPFVLDEQVTATTAVFAVDLDVPWQGFSFTNVALPAGASFDPPSGGLVWTPTEADGPGVFTGRFVAVDSYACFPLTITGELVFVVSEANRAPQWTPQGAVTIPAGVPVEIAPLATDPDWPPQTLTYHVDGLPFGLQMNPVSGRITGSTLATGNYEIVLVAADDVIPPLETTNRFTLTITAPFGVLGAALQTGAPRFTFPTLANELYRVETSDSLASPDWQPLGVVTSPASGVLDWLDMAPATSRYFRVRWLRY